MADVELLEDTHPVPTDSGPVLGHDLDPVETAEWLGSLEYVLASKGPERVKFLLAELEKKAKSEGVQLPAVLNTPYINTIPVERQPRFPGHRDIERRIKSIIRWNAMAMVSRANKEVHGIGGHISTYASSATLYEIGFNHFFRGRGVDGFSGDQIYFQGHASPGIYARAFLEGRLTEEHLVNFRRELAPGGGLSSYPHPWLMPGFWEFPTVSMGLAPIMAIYQARFNKYLRDRGIRPNADQGHVWAFLGDGECDEPETLGAITLASREKLDNLIFVINCNLQRLDGPVRGNGSIIQELEAIFRGAGWNVIKVIWGDDWDPLLAKDQDGLLAKRMGEIVDGQYQKYTVMPGAYIREHFFGKYPQVAEMVANYADRKLETMRRGGHDPEKVYAAFQAAVDCEGRPTVILAKTIKGYGLGEAGEGRNTAHNEKELNEKEMLEFRSRFGIPISDAEVASAPFYKPPEDSVEMRYLREHREALGGYVPTRSQAHPITPTPPLADYKEFLAGSAGREMSTTMGFVRLLTKLCRDKRIGKHVVPIVPDESRTFGMEGMFKEFGIYSHSGQLYEPVDREIAAYYKEAVDGQILEEGINEAGSMSSFIAAGSAYASHGINMIPFFVYYSMFGFQRIGDLIWAAADMRTKGFLIGGTAGRTTLNGEGLQHQDGQSLLNAIAFPTVRAYDPAYAYETAVIVLDGLRRLYAEGETAIYYLTVENDNYVHPPMPAGAEEGIIRGIYQVAAADVPGAKHVVQLFGSGAILRSALEARGILAAKYGIGANVWSVTSYNQLRRDCQACERWNFLHPAEPPRQSYLEQVLCSPHAPRAEAGTPSVPANAPSTVFIAASDYVRALPEQLRPWIPGDYFALGTDGLGRSESRPALRRHFEVDAQCITLATLYRLHKLGHYPASFVAQAIKDLGIDPEKIDPFTA